MNTAPRPLLEVVALQPADAGPAQEGGADRLAVMSAVDQGGLSPEPSLVSAICRESDLPVRVMLRLNDTLSTTGGELTRLIGLAGDYLAVGAEGVICGFLDDSLLIDTEVCHAIADAYPGMPWTFHRAVDATFETARVWRQLRELPGLDAVMSAGSPRGLTAGFEDLADLAMRTSPIARLLMAGGGLTAEHVPWLLRAGVRQFHVGRAARPGHSWKAYVDSRHVRSWRLLLDDALEATRP